MHETSAIPPTIQGSTGRKKLTARLSAIVAPSSMTLMRSTQAAGLPIDGSPFF
ncbi:MULTISPECIES: hypothetical protein [unclassified Streptomyces]|uniref:hypothetical protein n=1 Tax=unclassified Streptomyces TaxID=2593676 RepID=UPI0013E3CC50|nr:MULTISPECIES: hypothetical protein [unclassified Streptomyces]